MTDCIPPSIHPVDEILGRIAAISNQVVKVKAFHQIQGLRDVMLLASRQTQTQGVSQPVYGDMHLGAEATSTAPQRLRRLPATFIGRRQHRDEPAQSYYRSSRFPGRDHPQNAATSVPTPSLRCPGKHPVYTNGRSVCKQCSIGYIRRATAATAPHYGSSRAPLQQIGDNLLHSYRDKHAVRSSESPGFSTIARHLVTCLT